LVIEEQNRKDFPKLYYKFGGIYQRISLFHSVAAFPFVIPMLPSSAQAPEESVLAAVRKE
jgi:hypothetical protein